MTPTPSDPAVTAGPAAQRPGRLSGLPALLLVVGIWAFAGVATIAITVLTSVGPVLIVLGLWTRWAALVLAFTMGVAFFVVNGAAFAKGELAWLYLGGYLVLFVAGAGKLSLDKK